MKSKKILQRKKEETLTNMSFCNESTAIKDFDRYHSRLYLLPSEFPVSFEVGAVICNKQKARNVQQYVINSNVRTSSRTNHFGSWNMSVALFNVYKGRNGRIVRTKSSWFPCSFSEKKDRLVPLRDWRPNWKILDPPSDNCQQWDER